MYGNSYGVYNVHVLTHLTCFVKLLGPLDVWSAFPFENNLNMLKRSLRSPVNLSAQLENRYFELDLLPIETKQHSVKLSNKYPNNIMLTESGVVYADYIKDNMCSGFKCVLEEDIYSYPYPSRTLGIGIYVK